MGRLMKNHALEWYRGRRVFVTGHTGFKGAWLCLWLQKLGASVTGYALQADEQSLYLTAGIETGMTSIIGDIRDLSMLKNALSNAEPEIIFHMAAQSLVRHSYKFPRETFETNMMGTVNLLDAARSLPSLRSVIVVTSDKCYDNKEFGIAFTENAAMGGSDPYSASKGCAELASSAYAQSYYDESPIVLSTARAGNVIGGCDWADDRIIPDLIRSNMTKTTVDIRRPGAIRPWQHVLEPLRGYMMLAIRAATDGKKYNGGWNFGPRQSDTATVRTIVNLILKEWPDLKVNFAKRDLGPHEAGHLKLDCTKADNQLAWRPILSLADAITMTLDLYRTAIKHPDTLKQSALSQIQNYEDRFQGVSMERQDE